MSNKSEQNGRQNSEERTAPPTDPRTRGVKAATVVRPISEPKKVCRDFVWGICSGKDKCKYKHELTFESMRSILRFCHDYQNRTGCLRPDCTYLHTSRDEQNAFFNNGVIPRVLVERYSAMYAQEDSQIGTAPQIMYMNDYMGQAPPPPPGGSTAPVQPTLSSCLGIMPATNAQNVQPQLPAALKITLPAMPSTSSPVPPQLPSIFNPPPPPPPPPNGTTASPLTGPNFTGAPAVQHTHTVTPLYPVTPSQQPQQLSQTALQYSPQSASQFSLPAIYNPSVPPPPIPITIQSNVQKRPHHPVPAQEAVPSKVTKLNDLHETMCEACIDRNFRRELCRTEIERLHQSEELKRQEYDTKSSEFEKGRMMLRAMLSPHMFQAADEFIDMSDASMPSSSTNIFPSSSTSSNNQLALPKQLLFELMQYLISKAHQDQTTPLESLTRRTFSDSEFSRLTRASDLQSFTSLLDRLTNTSESRAPSLDVIRANGLPRLSNGGIELATPTVTRYQVQGVPAAPRYTSPAFLAEPLSPPFQPEPAPVYVPYQPTIRQPPAPQPAPPQPQPAVPQPTVAQPPTRPYYQAYPPSNNVSYGAATPMPPLIRAAPSPTNVGAAPSSPYRQYLPQQHNPYRPYQ